MSESKAAKAARPAAAKAASSINEFCSTYGICRQTFYDEVHRGRLRAVKLGKKTLVLREDAMAWAASLPPLKLAGAAE